MLNNILFFTAGILLFFGSMAFHELGHWLAFYRYGYRTSFYIRRKGIGFNIETGRDRDYILLTDEQYLFICLSGVVLGYIPIVIAGVYNGAYLMLSLPYFWGAMADVVNIVKLIEKGTIKWED